MAVTTNKKPRNGWQAIRGINQKTKLNNHTLEASNGQETSQEARTTASGLLYSLSIQLRDDRHAVCFTSKQNPSAYNLFRGYPLVSKKGDWSLMRRLIQDVICDGNEEHFDYMKAWIARAVKFPGGDRPGVAVVLKGEKGVGKGVFVNNPKFFENQLDKARCRRCIALHWLKYALMCLATSYIFSFFMWRVIV